MPELLLEVLSEEIPARMQARAAEDLKRLVTAGLADAGLTFDEAKAFATPRRLALVVDGIPAKQPDATEERRGPRADAPAQAVKGFRGSLPKGARVEKRETEKGVFYFATIKQTGEVTEKILKDVLGSTLNRFPWPKSMRWAEGDLRWVRPIQNVLAVFNRTTVPFSIGLKSRDGKRAWGEKPSNLFDSEKPLTANNQSSGHPFLAPKPFRVRGFKDYRSKLLKAKVMLDGADRQAKIEADAGRLAKKAGLRLKPDPGLLAEVAGLCEWPVARLGTIDTAFMKLPDEVLTTVMRRHQKYFALLDKRGKLAPKFVVVADTETRDRGRAVVAGNERVLRARLADGKFFWDTDLKRRLDDRVNELGGRVYHAKLGTMLDKAIRLEELSAAIAPFAGANDGDARWAARLAKADLSTEMVAEFPELQGVMGRYYALHDGEKADVADAIAEHYSPLGPGDACPSRPLSVTVALADRIDALVGFWAIGEKPTGSKDPFALRRAALGVIRLITENRLRLPLRQAFRAATGNLDDTIGGLAGGFDAAELLQFIAERLKVHLRGQGVPHDHVDAVFAVRGPDGAEDDLVRLLARVRALGAFLATDDGGNLLVAYKRAANIVRIEEKNDGARYDGAFSDDLLAEDAERTLAGHLVEATDGAGAALAADDFTRAMAAIARLRRPIDDFFDHVTVNCEDASLRQNRLRLLAGIGATLDRVADFSKLEGGER